MFHQEKEFSRNSHFALENEILSEDIIVFMNP